MKNRLVITECEPKEKTDTLYKVHDNSTVFLLTHSSDVAKYVYNQLKLDYKKERENASQV